MPAEIGCAMRMQTFGLQPSPAVRVLTKGPDYLRRQLEGTARARVSAVERLAADRAKYVKSQRPMVSAVTPSSASESSGSSSSDSYSGSAKKSDGSPPRPPPSTPQSNIVRRGSSKKLQRPDSLVMYRQKCKGQTGDSAQGNLAKRLAQSAIKDKLPDAFPHRLLRETSGEQKTRAAAVGSGDPSADGRQLRRAKAGLHRSQSDLTSRYSKTFCESDAFFRYCGLDPDVIEDLGGRENFAAVAEHVALRGRSVSVATSEGGFSRRSGDEDGLQEEDLGEQLPSCTSVVERNARIIKWLYSCKRARESKKVLLGRGGQTGGRFPELRCRKYGNLMAVAPMEIETAGIKSLLAGLHRRSL
ncbi:protein FAM110C [Microcaecilia unicolor]|uniref:Protein FAM110C n=1 Tax=Microcaecilia unicolor TaxID=1415580 RepID=A0A6P7XH20_9AMPH|nr:protein FAM110C [Microcaecilia unicolor]